jgi:hypothetical protein
MPAAPPAPLVTVEATPASGRPSRPDRSQASPKNTTAVVAARTKRTLGGQAVCDRYIEKTSLHARENFAQSDNLVIRKEASCRSRGRNEGLVKMLASPPRELNLIGDADFARASEQRGQVPSRVALRRAVATPRLGDDRAARSASAPAPADKVARSSAPAPPASPCRAPRPDRHERRWIVRQTVHQRVPTTRR